MLLSPRSRRRLAALGGSVVLLVVSAGPASAHDELIATVPADGASVPSPGSVVLRFSEAVLPEFNRIELTRPDGSEVAATVAVSGSTVTGRLPAGLGAGAYRITWRATSADGHPVSGRFAFTVVAPPTASATPTPTTSPPTTTPSTTTTLTTAPSASVAPAQAASTPSPGSADESTGIAPGSTSAKVLAVGAALALLTSLVVLWRRRQAQPRG